MSNGFYTQKIIQRDGETYVNMAFDPSVRPLLGRGRETSKRRMGKPGRSESP